MKIATHQIAGRLIHRSKVATRALKNLSLFEEEKSTSHIRDVFMKLEDPVKSRLIKLIRDTLNDEIIQSDADLEAL